MAEFIIPKGKEYTFTIKVMERDSFIAQTLTSVGEVTVEFLLTSTSTSVFDTTMTVANAVDGVLQCTLTAAETALLTTERGDKVDGYYLKPTHQALITIPFTDGTPTIFTILDEVFVAPTSTITI